MPMQTTVGRLMVNEALPEDMRKDDRVLDKKALKDLLSELAQKHPEKYREVSHRLATIGHQVSTATGGYSFGLKHLRPAKAALRTRQHLRTALARIDADDSLTDEQREKKILTVVGRASEAQSKGVYDESLAENNPLAMQVRSGARGNPNNLTSLRGSDLLYTDHRGKALALPVLRSYSEGLNPAEYWAGSYGARKGTIDVKFATQDAGFLSKQLNQIAHRAVVGDLDGDGEPDTLRGYPVDTDDSENEGALLAYAAGGYKKNTVLSPKVLSDLRRRKVKRILVRSPMTGGTPDGGVYARDAGVREFGRLPTAGENVGLSAAQALSEPLSQAQLSSKHGGGVAGSTEEQATSGFALINQLVQTPKMFKGGAAHSIKDGLVQRIDPAPAGGKYVSIDSERHYVGEGFDLKVKQGDKVEAGDVLSEGIPNPSIIVAHKGVGEGRRYFVDAFGQAFKDAGIRGHRRNMELLANGLINHVRLTDEIGDYAPDDVVPYSVLQHRYKPRAGHQIVDPKAAVGQYLEKPYLHHTIGTKIRPSMLQDFKDFGVRELAVHHEAPPFQPEMIRGMSNLQHDPDWMTRMLGSGLKSSLLKGVHRGAYSDPTGTSYVPGLAQTVGFGTQGKVITPNAPKPDDADRQQMSVKFGNDLSSAAAELREKLAFGGAGGHGEGGWDSLAPSYVRPKPAEPQPLTGYRSNNEKAFHQLMALRRGREVYDENFHAKLQKAEDDWNNSAAGQATGWGRFGRQLLTDVMPPMSVQVVEQPRGPDELGREAQSKADAYGLTYSPPSFTQVQAPQGSAGADYQLPNITEDGSIPRPGYNLINIPFTEHAGGHVHHPQSRIAEYNAAMTGDGVMSTNTLSTVADSLKKHDPAAWEAAEKSFWTPENLWKYNSHAARENDLLDLWKQQNGDAGAPDFSQVASQDAPPQEWRQHFPGYDWGPQPQQPLTTDPHNTTPMETGAEPYVPHSQQLTSDPHNTAPTENGGVPYQPAKPPAPYKTPGTNYRAGPGLLPYMQMMERFSPGASSQFMQVAGPLGLPALIDMGAVASLTRGGGTPQRTARIAPTPQAVQPPTPRPAPVQPPRRPVTPPRVSPVKTPTAAKPTGPPLKALPKLPQAPKPPAIPKPAQPAKPPTLK